MATALAPHSGLKMRALVLYAHPVETSFVAALHARVVEVLRRRGHEVDDLDLYAEHFDPVLSRQTRIDYVDMDKNLAEVAVYVERLRAADALVLVFPVWVDGLPAILKGFFERVFLPGVSFRIDENGNFSPILWNIKRLAAVCTYGASRARTSQMGDPPRRFVKEHLRAMIAPEARCDYIAHYDMNFTAPVRRARFLKRVSQEFDAW